MTQLALCGAVAAVGINLSVASTAPATGAPKQTWHDVKASQTWRLDIQTLACTRQLQCVGIGRRGLSTFAVTLDGSGRLSQSSTGATPVPNGTMVCTTRQSCQALVRSGAVSSGHWRTTLYRTEDSGVRWSADSLPSSLDVVGFSCATTARCIAAGRPGQPSFGPVTTPDRIFVTRDGGAEWTPATSVPLMSSLSPSVLLSCAPDGACLAATWLSDPSRVESTTNFGRTWRPVGIPRGQDPYAVSCNSPVACSVLTDPDTSLTATSLFLWTVRDGDRRRPIPHRLPGTVGVTNISPGSLVIPEVGSMSCPTASVCDVSEGSTSFTTVLDTTVDDGLTWTAQQLPKVVGPEGWVACAPDEDCVAAGLGLKTTTLAVRR